MKQKQWRWTGNNYVEVGGEEPEPEKKENHGNTRLPFGLCKHYGIPIGDNWTPRDAWNALKGKGITPQKVYERLKKAGSSTPKEGNGQSNQPEQRTSPKTALSHMNDSAKKSFDDFQARTSGKHMLHEESLVCANDGTILLQKKGVKNKVSFSLAEGKQMKGGNLIHNHPSHNSILSPDDVDTSWDELKSITMCDLDGGRMTAVFADDISLKQRCDFAKAYQYAFKSIGAHAMKALHDEYGYDMGVISKLKYPDIKRKNLNYQDIPYFTEIVKSKLKEWTDSNAKKYGVEVYYE